MPRFDYVLFDADNTLFDFDRAEEEALWKTLAHYELPVTPAVRARYLDINRALWEQFDRGEVRREWLVVERFALLQQEFGGAASPEEMNRFYLARLGEGAYLLPGAEALCRTLAPHCTLAIVTNGVASVQHGRFDRTPLKDLIPHLFISEEIGFQKPQPEFFEQVFSRLNITDRSRAVVVGDSLSADILGAQNSGLRSIWYNPSALPPRPGITPTWEVRDYAALEALLLP